MKINENYGMMSRTIINKKKLNLLLKSNGHKFKATAIKQTETQFISFNENRKWVHKHNFLDN